MVVNHTPMLPFRVQFKPGPRSYDQVVYAVKKAIISGALQPGDGFPSVRVMSQELGINPNTAQKVIAALVEERLLIVKPGIGTVLAATRNARAFSGGTLSVWSWKRKACASTTRNLSRRSRSTGSD